MKYIITFCLILCNLPVKALMQDPDSVRINELNEIVIEAQMQHTSVNSSTYSPSARQRNAATDAISLLSQMAIPQLDVNPTTLSVTTVSGQSVSMFIDHVPATSQDLSGLRPADVRKVEYLINPQDPRFKGAQYAVNFVMRHYEWGGYTKINGSGSLGVNTAEGKLYSKFSFRSMTYDLYAGDSYEANHHFGSKSSESYYFTDLFGKGPHSAERTTLPVSSDYRKNTADITFRALYKSEKAQISNVVSFNQTSMPYNDSRSIVSYSVPFESESVVNKESSMHSLGVNYDMEAFLSFNRKLALDITVAYNYTHNKTLYLYNSTDNEILNKANEQAYNISISPNLVWNPTTGISVMPFLYAQHAQIGIDYTGNSPSKQDYKIWGGLLGSRFTYRYENWSVGGMFGWTYADTDLSGARIRDNYPTGNFFCSFSPNNHNQLELAYNYGKVVPETSQKSPTMLRQDELMWYSGSPGLKNFWNHRIGASYVWLPNNIWQMSADSYYFIENRRVISSYSPAGPDGTMLRRYLNNGNSGTLMVGASLTAKLLGGKIVGKVHPQFWHRTTSGEYQLTVNQLTCSAQVTWYIGNFYLFGWYSTPTTYINTDSGIKTRMPENYQFQAGWRNGGWQVSATAVNFLRSSWETYRQTLSGQYYGFIRTDYGTDFHMRYKLSVAYTFGYGKIVGRANEVAGAGTAESAILK